MSLEQAVSALLSRLDAVQNRLNEVEKQLASGAAPSGGASAGAASSGEVAPFVAEYDALLSQHIKPLVALTQKIGSAELKNQVSLLEKALDSQKQFLAVASASKKPDQNALNQLLAPTSKLIEEIVSIREKNRPSKQFNHLSTISEGISALGWVAVSPTPGPFVNEARASSEFYSNKILVEFKKLGADGHDNVEWVNHWNTWMKDLAAYIKKFHTTELTWNPRGGDASSAKVAAPSAGGPPPPPKAPGPPPPLPPPAAASGPSSADAQAALFASLNKGEGITSGLKKVTADMKSKNRTDKTSVVPASSAPAKAAPAKAGGAAKKGTPKLELQGNKWLVEFQDNNKNIEIKETEAKQTIYVYKTDNAFVRVHGKVNSIALDGCKKTAIVFDTAIAQCELVNSTGIELQVTGKVPSIAVDSCSGIQIFLSKDSLETEIVTSKSDTMNVLVPGTDGGDPVELPIPEQYKTLYKGGRLVTQSVEHV